ncbi:O-fucosyltransferase 8 isoform X2 [Populus alba x Populus x berolinensis]|uniref:O-fucosyltransferase family protein n=1 Tax=Populus alba x Populus x berolinensis TaxID=444605 RepID=A0AAD6Q656_9ROSI|nr:O-fucosyltransferase 8 isoform X2 [Populus alba x Populus x berolinensis]
MGKQGSPRSPRPDVVNVKDYHTRSSECLPGSDPILGRRLSGGDNNWKTKVALLHDLKHEYGKLGSCKAVYVGKRHLWFRKHVKSIVFMVALMGSLFLLDSFMVSLFDSINLQNSSPSRTSSDLKGGRTAYANEEPPVQMYGRLQNLAYSALAEKELKQEPSNFWEEPWKASLWKPCADRKESEKSGQPDKSNGYIMVSANGGLNQQRVAICNAVALASLLNATLVLPRFLYSNVWKDPSQFGDIYQEEYFVNVMKDEVNLITDAVIVKEAKPIDYLTKVLPLLLQNGVVHLLGFGNRLGFDPLPSRLQKLRCKCNFHALKFVPKIQEAGSLLIRRIRKYDTAQRMLDKQLVGEFLPGSPSKKHDSERGPSKYLALHLRFEVDMIAYSLCDFGGGEKEKRELQAYRESHFPLLIERLKHSKPVSSSELRNLGRCPLTPEEAALVLAGLGFKRGTYIYLASSRIYGGKSRMHSFTSLYPNLVTKETLLTPSELAPFRNFSSQLAALDFIACATADVFAMTDSGSQLSSLVSGFRTYYGGGHAPTLRPNKKMLAAILSENSTIGWKSFEDRARKMIEEGARSSQRSTVLKLICICPEKHSLKASQSRRGSSILDHVIRNENDNADRLLYHYSFVQIFIQL